MNSYSISTSLQLLGRWYSRPYCNFLVLQASILDVWLFRNCKKLGHKWRGAGLEISGRDWSADKVSALKSWGSLRIQTFRQYSRFGCFAITCTSFSSIYIQEFSREALICRQLCHPNVLPFFGVYNFDDRLCLVSPWMEDGHIMKFLAAKQPTNTKCLSLVRAFQLQHPG
jgi:serine/threonine protein kinase